MGHTGARTLQFDRARLKKLKKGVGESRITI